MQYSGTVHLPVTVPMMRYTDVSETLPRYGAVTTCHDTGMHARAAWGEELSAHQDAVVHAGGSGTSQELPIDTNPKGVTTCACCSR